MLPKTTGIVALALAASLALTGCAAGATPAADTSSKPAATVSPIPTRPTDPLEGKKSGDAIDAELAATINADWSGFADDRAYQMPSGEWVYLKRNEPLPKNVHDAVAGILMEVGRPQLVTSRANNSVAIRFREAEKVQEEAVGRHIVLVIHAMNADPQGGPERPRWSTGDAETDGYNGTSKAEATAIVQSWVDKSPGTRTMIVLDGLAG